MNTVAVSGRSGQACVARLLEPTADSPPLVRAVNGAMLALIAVNLLAMVLESVAEIHAMAPRCEHCGCKIIGHGMEVGDGKFYCCAHCASQHGVHELEDRVETA